MKKTIPFFFILSFCFNSCTSDREIQSKTITIDPSSVLVHYWNFNTLSGSVTTVNPDLTLLPSSASISYTGSGAGYMDAFAPGYDLNARNNDVSGSGLRTRNPSDTRNLVLKVPTTGYKTIVVQFATAKSSSGATTQKYSYTTDGTNYITTGLETIIFSPTDDPTSSLVTLDFSAISQVNDNPNFKIKISFTGINASLTTGNNRFDNISLVGIPLSLTAPPSNLSYTAVNSFIINSTITSLNPSVMGTVAGYAVTPSLPAGLSLDATTGIISGTPTVTTTATNYVITATNNYGTTNFTISIAVTAVANTTLYLLHYWNFNSLATGTLTTVNADASLITSSNATIKYNGTGAGYMDQYTPGSTVNSQNADVAGLGLRLRNPSDTRNLLISGSTVGYKNVIVKFAIAKSSATGASVQNYSYTIDGTNFITTGLSTTSFSPNIDPIYDTITLDFSGLPNVNNNPNFAVKINFGGVEATGTSGNNRIDNVTFQANQL